MILNYLYVFLFLTATIFNISYFVSTCAMQCEEWDYPDGAIILRTFVNSIFAFISFFLWTLIDWSVIL